MKKLNLRRGRWIEHRRGARKASASRRLSFRRRLPAGAGPLATAHRGRARLGAAPRPATAAAALAATAAAAPAARPPGPPACLLGPGLPRDRPRPAGPASPLTAPSGPQTWIPAGARAGRDSGPSQSADWPRPWARTQSPALRKFDSGHRIWFSLSSPRQRSPERRGLERWKPPPGVIAITSPPPPLPESSRGGEFISTLLTGLPGDPGEFRPVDQMARTVRRRRRCGRWPRRQGEPRGGVCSCWLARRAPPAWQGEGGGGFGLRPALGSRAPIALDVRLSNREAKGIVAATASPAAASLHPETRCGEPRLCEKPGDWLLNSIPLPKIASQEDGTARKDWATGPKCLPVRVKSVVYPPRGKPHPRRAWNATVCDRLCLGRGIRHPVWTPSRNGLGATVERPWVGHRCCSWPPPQRW